MTPRNEAEVKHFIVTGVGTDILFCNDASSICVSVEPSAFFIFTAAMNTSPDTYLEQHPCLSTKNSSEEL